MAIDVDNDFTPIYAHPPVEEGQGRRAEEEAESADELLLATDEETGEGRGNCLAPSERSKPKVPVRRMVFHEITKTRFSVRPRNPRAQLFFSLTSRSALTSIALWLEVSEVEEGHVGLSAGRSNPLLCARR